MFLEYINLFCFFLTFTLITRYLLNNKLLYYVRTMLQWKSWTDERMDPQMPPKKMETDKIMDETNSNTQPVSYSNRIN